MDDTASSGHGVSGHGGTSGRGHGGRGTGNVSVVATGEDQTLSGVGQTVFKQQQESANDGSAAVTKPDGESSKKYCTLRHKHGHWESQCPGQVCTTCGENDHSTNVWPSGREDATFARFYTDLDPEELLLEFDALVAETGETSQKNDTAGKQVV